MTKSNGIHEAIVLQRCVSILKRGTECYWYTLSVSRRTSLCYIWVYVVLFHCMTHTFAEILVFVLYCLCLPVEYEWLLVCEGSWCTWHLVYMYPHEPSMELKSMSNNLKVVVSMDEYTLVWKVQTHYGTFPYTDISQSVFKITSCFTFLLDRKSVV